MEPQQTLDIDRLTDKKKKLIKRKIDLLNQLVQNHTCQAHLGFCSCSELYIELGQLKTELRARG